ncbi:10464_t:CDS:2, partial [Scutellospora calospora]
MAFSSVNDLTARLEKLEQNITLTLQEIDNNFSMCQHKVTTRILPQISRFAEISEDIWENSKLWWSFFESLDLSTLNDNSSPPSTDYINSKKKLVDGLSNSKENKADDEIFIDSTKKATDILLETGINKLSENFDNSNSKKKFDEILTNAANNNSKTTNSSIYPPSAKYLSISSTPLQDPPKLDHKLLQSPAWGEKIQKKKVSEDLSHATNSTYISMPALPPSDRKPNTLIERVMQRQQILTRQTPLKPIIENNKNSYNGANFRPSSYFPGGPPSSRGTDSDFAEFSPPVTIQFSVAPSKLLKTPAKEAAKIIVDDLISILSPVPPTPVSVDEDGYCTVKSKTFSNVLDSKIFPNFQPASRYEPQ